MAVPAFFTPSNPLFATYACHTGLLCTKMFAMTLLTSRVRYQKKVFASTEDVIFTPGGRLDFGDEDVERVRRAHLNDLENIPPFLIVSFLYILTAPAERTAVRLFRAYTTARLVHTVVYAVMPLPQPARAVSFSIGFCISVYMATQVIRHFRR